MISEVLQNLMPQPAHVEARAGVFSFGALQVSGSGAALDVVKSALRRAGLRLGTHHGLAFDIQFVPTGNCVISCNRFEAVPRPDMDESYVLRVGAEGIAIEAESHTGALRAIQTLYQMVQPHDQGWCLPFCHIEDKPRFAWRGVLLDVSRHFMRVRDVERLLDGMEIAKLNVLHFHLSNDQGFRLESKVHPRLHQVGSEGEFYTQVEMRQLIDAASARGIRVVPEFCLPGHSVSWQVAYPDLSASLVPPVEVGELREIFSVPVDPTREALYRFVDAFVAEMAALFPDPYFHTGGDEVNPKAWKENPEIARFMAAQGLATYRDLQAYFTGRYAQIVRAHGKIAIGWEEILHAQVDENVLIHLWKDGVYPKELARHQVLVSWNYYLDLQQPAQWLYEKDPMDFQLTDGASPEVEVLGAEMANWSETIDGDNLDQRTWPRGLAMAERFWSPRAYVEAEGRQRLYPRLAIASGLLTSAGLSHETHLASAMVSLYGAEAGEDFCRFASMVEPAAYPFVRRRRLLLEQLLPKLFKPPVVQRYSDLRRFVDHLPGESEVARQFSEAVRVFLENRDPVQRAALERQLRDWQTLGRTMAMHASHVSAMKREGLHRVALGLATVARAGLAALPHLAQSGSTPCKMGRLQRFFWNWRLWPYAYDIFYLDKDLLRRIAWELRKPDVLNRHHVAIYPGVAHLLKVAGEEG